jgi:putative nucleotidyltransferase with HDIG domain
MTFLDEFGAGIEVEDLSLSPVVTDALAHLKLQSPETYQHSVSVAVLSRLIAGEMNLGADVSRKAFEAGLLHDFGKVVDSRILTLIENAKPLSVVDRIMVQLHPSLAASFFVGKGISSDVVKAVWTHHERPDGEGYYGFSGDKFPMLGRIVAVADYFHARTTNEGRSYRGEVLSGAEAWACIQDGAGTEFDGDVVGVLGEIGGRVKIFTSTE